MTNYVPTGKPFKKPLKFKTVEELEKGIDAYFASLYDYARDMWGNRLKDKDYKKVVGKYVRKDHIQTDDHWTKKPIVRNGLALTLV